MNTMGEKPTDLLDDQYSDTTNIGVRHRFHERFSQREVSREEWVFRQLQLPADGRVIDVGCGEGTIWQYHEDQLPPGLDVTLLDFSPGILSEAAPQFTLLDIEPDFTAATVQRLPFDDDIADSVLAMQMLYHVPDRQAAYAEFQRVLRDGGCIYGTAPREHNCQELWDLINEATGTSVPSLPLTSSGGFTPETAESEFRSHFGAVETSVYENELVVDDTDAIVEWALSVVGLDGIELGSETVATLKSLVREQLADGPIVTNVDYVLVAAEP